MSFASEFIANRFVDTKGKKIEAVGERWMLVPAEVIAALHRTLPPEELEKAGESLAEEIARNIKKRLHMDNSYVFVKLAEKGVSTGGWGKLTVEDFDAQKTRGIVSCEDPPAGGCRLMRGMIAGLCKTITGKNMEVRETEFTEKGCRKIRFYVSLKAPATAPRD